MKWTWTQAGGEKKMPLTGHLEELRSRIAIALATVGGSCLALYPLSNNLLLLVRSPITEQLYMLAPAEAFVVHLKLTIFGAVVISSPMTLYQIWAFTAPALYENEKRYALPFVVTATIFFLLGGLFAYTVILPFGLRFLLGFSESLIEPVISVSAYVSFVTKTILAFGAVFELPVIVVFLSRMGIVSPGMLRSFRKYAIVAAFVLGAILTPPDIFTQALLAGPLIVLYEISIWACAIVSKKFGHSHDS